MDLPTPRTRSRGIWTSLAVTAASALTAAGMTFPATIANADPVAPSPAPAPAPAGGK